MFFDIVSLNHLLCHCENKYGRKANIQFLSTYITNENQKSYNNHDYGVICVNQYYILYVEHFLDIFLFFEAELEKYLSDRHLVVRL